MGWRRGSESNRRIKVLQTSALPLGYRAPGRSFISEHTAPRRAVSTRAHPLAPRAVIHWVNSITIDSMALLTRKVALITGAATGIGESIARTFASEGARVAVFDRDGAGAERVAADIRATGGAAVACQG